MYRVLLCFILFAGCCYALPSGKVAGGTNATLGEVPYIVSLRIFNKHFCAGSIIDKKHILTSARCVQGYDQLPNIVTVQYGVSTITEDETNSIPAKKIVSHPYYYAGCNYPNNIALIKLEREIPLNKYAKAVKLPKQDDRTPGNKKAVLAGWGASRNSSFTSSTLQRVELKCYTDDDCANKYPFTNKYMNICAGVPTGDEGECGGDSGGPLIVNNVQVGIVSGELKPCDEKNLGIYIKVSNFIKWINKEKKID